MSNQWFTPADQVDEDLVESIYELVQSHSIPDVLGGLVRILEDIIGDMGSMGSEELEKSEQLHHVLTVALSKRPRGLEPWPTRSSE